MRLRTKMPKVSCPLGKCDGNGKISYVEHEPEDTKKDLGNGLYAGPATTYGSRLCECREQLEPREGEARWWSSETVYEGQWQSSVHQHQAVVKVSAEVPISDENFKVHRRGNRYYPTSVDVDLSLDWLHALFPEEARELAALLIAAADKVDEIDNPDADECGHWFPCDCRTRTKTEQEAVPF